MVNGAIRPSFESGKQYSEFKDAKQLTKDATLWQQTDIKRQTPTHRNLTAFADCRLPPEESRVSKVIPKSDRLEKIKLNVTLRTSRQTLSISNPNGGKTYKLTLPSISDFVASSSAEYHLELKRSTESDDWFIKTERKNDGSVKEVVSTAKHGVSIGCKCEEFMSVLKDLNGLNDIDDDKIFNGYRPIGDPNHAELREKTPDAHQKPIDHHAALDKELEELEEFDEFDELKETLSGAGAAPIAPLPESTPTPKESSSSSDKGPIDPLAEPTPTSKENSGSSDERPKDPLPGSTPTPKKGSASSDEGPESTTSASNNKPEHDLAKSAPKATGTTTDFKLHPIRPEQHHTGRIQKRSNPPLTQEKIDARKEFPAPIPMDVALPKSIFDKINERNNTRVQKIKDNKFNDAVTNRALLESELSKLTNEQKKNVDKELTLRLNAMNERAEKRWSYRLLDPTSFPDIRRKEFDQKIMGPALNSIRTKLHLQALTAHANCQSNTVNKKSEKTRVAREHKENTVLFDTLLDRNYVQLKQDLELKKAEKNAEKQKHLAMAQHRLVMDELLRTTRERHL